MLTEKVSKFLIPGTWHLLKSIDGFVEVANMVWVQRIEKYRKLLHKDLLTQLSMQEGIINIKLAQRPTVRNNNAKNDPNSGRFDN